MQEIHGNKRKKLYHAFVEPDKASDRVHTEVTRWALTMAIYLKCHLRNRTVCDCKALLKRLVLPTALYKLSTLHYITLHYITYQPLKLVGRENVPLFRIRHDEYVLSLMLAVVKVSFSKFNMFLIILFLFFVYYSIRSVH